MVFSLWDIEKPSTHKQFLTLAGFSFTASVWSSNFLLCEAATFCGQKLCSSTLLPSPFFRLVFGCGGGGAYWFGSAPIRQPEEICVKEAVLSGKPKNLISGALNKAFVLSLYTILGRWACSDPSFSSGPSLLWVTYPFRQCLWIPGFMKESAKRRLSSFGDGKQCCCDLQQTFPLVPICCCSGFLFSLKLH